MSLRYYQPTMTNPGDAHHRLELARFPVRIELVLVGIERGEALLDLRPPRERQQAQAFVGQPGEVGGLAQPAVWIQCGSAHCSDSLQMGGRAPHSGAATATRQDRTDDGAFGPRGPGWMNSRMPLHPSLRKARRETPSSHSSPTDRTAPSTRT